MPSGPSAADALPAARLVLFDLDGTLVHSLPDLAFSIDSMLADLGMAPRGEAAIRNWLGDGVDALVQRALVDGREEAPDSALLERAMPLFMDYYASNNGERSRPYPGARQLLEVLRNAGLQLGCVTNKSQAFTTPLLQRLGLYACFDCVISGDQVTHKKPHPEPLLTACRVLGVLSGEALFVGDSTNDVRAARAAGMAVVCVSYGYSRGEDIIDARPDALVDELSEVSTLLDLA